MKNNMKEKSRLLDLLELCKKMLKVGTEDSMKHASMNLYIADKMGWLNISEYEMLHKLYDSPNSFNDTLTANAMLECNKLIALIGDSLPNEHVTSD